MLTDLQIALLLQSQYNGEAIFDIVKNIAGVDFAVKHFDDCTAILFEGSHDAPDWENDFRANMIETSVGGVHSGFYNGLPDVIAYLATFLHTDRPLKVCGHSLGGGRAHIATALLAQAGFMNLETITFGSPLPGDMRLSNYIGNFPNRPYWNYGNPIEHDLVGDVPVKIPLEPYIFPRPRIKVKHAPTYPDPWLLLAWHHIQLYIAALTAMEIPNG